MKLQPGSPTKILSKKHKSSLEPTQQASAAAYALLMTISSLNPPDALARALSNYLENPNEYLDARQAEEDSYIAQRADRLRSARCCWEILKEGFIESGDNNANPGPSRPRPRRGRRRTTEEEGDEDIPMAALSPISDRGWGILSWILALFEKNELAVEATEGGEFGCTDAVIYLDSVQYL